MSDERLTHAIREVYAAHSAPPATTELLVELAQARGDAVSPFPATTSDRHAQRGGSSNGIAPWVHFVIGIAACICAYVLGYRNAPRATFITAPGLTGTAKNPAAEAQPVATSRDSERDAYRGQPVFATIPEIIERPSADSGATSPTLVLMKVGADWCPRSPRVAPIFDELAGKYSNQPLLIVSFDVTTPEKRKQCAYLADSLGILSVLGHKWEPGMIRLIDRERGEVVESLREINEQPHFEDVLVHALPSRK